MAKDAYDYAETLPESRFKRRLKRLEKLSEGSIKARPGFRGRVTNKSRRRREKKEGSFYAT